MTNQTQNTKEYNDFIEAMCEWYMNVCLHHETTIEVYDHTQDTTYRNTIQKLVKIYNEDEFTQAENILSRNERKLSRVIKGHYC